jgi:hypothetical protein
MSTGVLISLETVGKDSHAGDRPKAMGCLAISLPE